MPVLSTRSQGSPISDPPTWSAASSCAVPPVGEHILPLGRLRPLGVGVDTFMQFCEHTDVGGHQHFPSLAQVTGKPESQSPLKIAPLGDEISGFGDH